MKQTYPLHYNRDLNFARDEMIEIDLEEVGECPHCHIATSPTYINGYLISSMENNIPTTAFVIFYCPKCHNLYIAQYYIPNGSIGVDINIYPYAIYPNSPKEIEFPDNINDLSPMFVSTYKQALYAEADKNTIGLSGLGYRKALEFLIKDYLIKLKHKDKDKTIALELGQCVSQLDSDLQDIARASVWLGNDETHYFRKNPKYDLEDLKTFINCLVADIEREYVRIKAKQLTNCQKK